MKMKRRSRGAARVLSHTVGPSALKERCLIDDKPSWGQRVVQGGEGESCKVQSEIAIAFSRGPAFIMKNAWKDRSGGREETMPTGVEKQKRGQSLSYAWGEILPTLQKTEKMRKPAIRVWELYKKKSPRKPGGGLLWPKIARKDPRTPGRGGTVGLGQAGVQRRSSLRLGRDKNILRGPR